MHSHVVHDAWADYRKAVAERRRRETEQAFAPQNEERAKRLLADKAVSPQELQRAEADRVAARRAARHGEDRGAPRRGGARALRGHERGGPERRERASTIPVRSPLGGVVLEKSVTPGHRGDGRDAPLRGGRPDRAVGGGRDRRDAAPAGEGRPRRPSCASPPTRASPSPARITFVGRHGQPEDAARHRALPGAEPRRPPEAGDVRRASRSARASRATVLAVPVGRGPGDRAASRVVFVKTAQGPFERRDVDARRARPRAGSRSARGVAGGRGASPPPAASC